MARSQNNQIDIENAVVKIYTEAKRYNYAQPWQAPAQTNFSGSGFVINDRKILTSAHVIANQAHVEVRLANDATRYEAKVLKFGHDCDLALMTVEDDDFWSKATSLELGDMPKVRAKVNVFGFPVGGEELSITEGITSRIEVQEYVHSRAHLLTIQIDAAINDGNSGGPVLTNQKVVGVAHQGIDMSQSIGYIIPINVIRHFLADEQGEKYQGFPELAIQIQPMENKTLRSSFGLQKDQSGVRIAKIDHLSIAKDVLFENDVILKVNQTVVNNDGTMRTDFANRVDISHLFTMLKLGDHIQLEILRNQEIMQFDLQLKNTLGDSLLVPLKEFDRSPTFYIFSGVIVQPLTFNYMEDVWGEQLDGAPLHFLNAYFYGRKKEPHQQVVILNRVLSTDFNSGYRDIEDVIIKKANGKEIHHINELIEAIETHTGEFHRLETHNHQQIVVENLKPNGRHAKFLSRYSIEHDRSEDLREAAQA